PLRDAGLNFNSRIARADDLSNPNPAQRVISMPPIWPLERNTTIASTLAVMSAVSASVVYSGLTRLRNSGGLKPDERGDSSAGMSSINSPADKALAESLERGIEACARI